MNAENADRSFRGVVGTTRRSHPHHQHPQRGRSGRRDDRLDAPPPPGFLWTLPVVAETDDGMLNDAEGFHVKAEHVFAALYGAAGGPVREGTWEAAPA